MTKWSGLGDSTELSRVGLSQRPPCSHAGRSGFLYTLFDQDHDSVFFSFWSIKPAMLPASMLGDYSTSASSTPSCFPYCTHLLGNPFPITSLLDLHFSSLSFFGSSYRPSCPPWCSDTTHECIFDALWIFSSSFRSIGSLLPIGRHSTSLHSAKLQTGRLLRWTCPFSFLTNVHAIRPADSSTTSSWPF
jgi:hypothetical protein